MVGCALVSAGVGATFGWAGNAASARSAGGVNGRGAIVISERGVDAGVASPGVTAALRTCGGAVSAAEAATGVTGIVTVFVTASGALSGRLAIGGGCDASSDPPALWSAGGAATISMASNCIAAWADGRGICVLAKTRGSAVATVGSGALATGVAAATGGAAATCGTLTGSATRRSVVPAMAFASVVAGAGSALVGTAGVCVSGWTTASGADWRGSSGSGRILPATLPPLPPGTRMLADSGEGASGRTAAPGTTGCNAVSICASASGRPGVPRGVGTGVNEGSDGGAIGAGPAAGGSDGGGTGCGIGLGVSAGSRMFAATGGVTASAAPACSASADKPSCVPLIIPVRSSGSGAAGASA